jgi:hypothetical protein
MTRKLSRRNRRSVKRVSRRNRRSKNMRGGGKYNKSYQECAEKCDDGVGVGIANTEFSECMRECRM